MIPLVQSSQKAFAFMDSHLGSFVKPVAVSPWTMDIDFSEETTAGWETYFVPNDNTKIFASGSNNDSRFNQQVIENGSNDNCYFDLQDTTYGISSNLSNTSWLFWWDFYQDTNSSENNSGFFGMSAVTGQSWSIGTGSAMVLQINANASTFIVNQQYNNGATLHSGYLATIYGSTAIDTQYYGRFQRDSATATSSAMYTNADRSTGEVGSASQTPPSAIQNLRYVSAGNEAYSGGGNDIKYWDRIRVEDGTTTPP